MAIEIWYDFPLLKSGKRSKRFECVGCFRYTAVDQCETCGRFGSTAWVRKWWYQRYPRYSREAFPHEPVLCIGCFNKIRPLWKADIEAHELSALARRLSREIASARKDENRWRPPRLPSGDDGGGAERGC